MHATALKPPPTYWLIDVLPNFIDSSNNKAEMMRKITILKLSNFDNVSLIKEIVPD
jgi:hypothetical protein